MKFNKATSIKTYFNTLDEAKVVRYSLWAKVAVHLAELQEKIDDDFYVENNMFVVNDFFDKSLYSLDKVDVVLEFNDEDFELFVESGVIKMYEHDNIVYHIRNITKDRYYTFQEGYLKENNFKLEIKENI